jgi:hypothetical protein
MDSSHPTLTDVSQLFRYYDQTENIKKPVILSKGQGEILQCLITRRPERVQILCPTQYGKSFTVSMGILLRAATFPEKWAVVAPNEAKAKIIMRYVIDHIFNNQIFIDQLDVNDPLERLRKEQSKTRITFKRGGELFILSADAKNKAAAGEALMGFGAPNLVIDESSLIDDDIYSKIKRMVGGSADNFLLEIGNPFKRNHFLRTFRDDSYKKIKIDWKQAVKEGRLTQKFIDEMRKEAFFDVLYECNFPREEDVDMDGWSRLLSDTDIEQAMRDEDPNVYGTKKLGIDVARGGGNFNVWVLRTGNYAKILAKTSQDNLMEVIGTSKQLAQENGVDESHVYLDATGLGAAVYDRFRETGWDINGINLSSQADDMDKYANKRAEIYFRLREWVKAGGMLEDNIGFYELGDIKYKLRSSGKLKIIDKDSLRRVGIPSPDIADAIALTFADPEETSFTQTTAHVMEVRKKQTIINKYE